MSDVARAAGVSVMTVSNVLNERTNVGADTRLRVLEVVEELGYEINLTARRLRSGRTGTIGLIVPQFDLHYYGELASRISEALAPEGMHLVVEQSGASRERELSALSLARLQQYDGVLLSAVGLDMADLDRIHPDVPIVLLGEQAVPERYHRVRMGNVEGARLATEHLVGCGARRVAVLGGKTSAPHPEMATYRTDGWSQALDQAGLPHDPALVIPLTTYSIAEARSAISAAVDGGLEVDAIFAVTDEVAIGALAGLHDAGLRVPEDVQLAGFDNLGISAHLVPGLTTIDPDHPTLVTEALRLLRRQLKDRTADPEHVVSGARLVARGTTRGRSAP
ncbi:LacI family transcriptional regulator [Isoptericola sp. NEAU-Y5]|uniref:LacI family transcriptional regulator n=1 Tax=Isoptericola luteus TaxID=2879484 RepID=A0ABS7ZDE5_9MICO|nr:LacI family DNA-binding transcriptional regulator [Isoptericola sp. NEAU-Y5]MCA5892948.1 LacI family transcriptional regulator [Isoptericola sp. NEAU-Y5]